MEYLAHYEKTPRMWSQGLHAHDYYEIYIHVEGARLYCVDDVIYELKPNQLLIIPPLHMHGLICDRDLENYERGYIYLTPETLHKCGMGYLNLSDYIEKTSKENKLLFDLSEASVNSCIDNIKNIENLSSQDKNLNYLEIYSSIFRILQIMVSAIGSEKNARTKISGDNRIIEVLHYINDNFTQDLSVETISEVFHQSPSSLSHKFRQYVNKGIYEYITYKRIILAKELMYTDLPLTEISFRCGFSDYSNFLRVFKKHEGLSPREYRQRRTM